MRKDEKDTAGPHEPDLNLLAALADGTLDASAAEKLRAHLADCRACRETAALMARALPEESRRMALPPAAGWLALAATLVLATIVGIRVARVEAPATPVPERPRPPSPLSMAEPPPAPAATSPPAPPAVRPDVKRGGREKTIGGKTFRLVAGEWVDSAYDATAELPVVEAAGPAARRQLVADRPALAPYLELGERVLVVLEGTVYRTLP